MNKSKSNKRWNPWDGAFRVAGEGCLGIYQGSNLWTKEAAVLRAKNFINLNIATKVWIEVYEAGIWKKIGNNIPIIDLDNNKKDPWFYQFYN